MPSGSSRTVSCARPTRSWARPRRFSPRRSSTARSSEHRGGRRLHRRPPGAVRGRADLQGPARRRRADRPEHLLRRQDPASLGAVGQRCGHDEGDRQGARGQLRRLRGHQGPCRAAPTRSPDGPVHGAPADARGGSARDHPGQGSAHHCGRHRPGDPPGSGGALLHRRRSGPAVGRATSPIAARSPGGSTPRS